MLYTLIALLLWWQPLSLCSRSSQNISVGGSRSETFYSLVKMSGKQTVKILPPRPLTATETTHSLSQWRINFKQYCKKDETFKFFLQTTTKWDFSKDNAGFLVNEGTRTPAVLKEDLQDFLLMLASYLPHGYLTDKLLTKSKSLDPRNFL